LLVVETVIVAVALSAKVMLTRYLALGGIVPVRGVVLDLAVVAVFVGLACAAGLTRGWRFWLWSVDAVLSFVFLATVVYAAYYGEVITPRALSLAGQAGELGASFEELLAPAHMWFFADALLLAAVEWLWWKRGPRQAIPALAGWRPLRLVAAGTAAAGIVAFVWASVAAAGIAGPLNPTTVCRSRGVFVYQVASVFHREGQLAEEAIGELDGVEDRDAAIIAVIDEAVGGREGPRIAGVEHGVASGANVIAIQFESLQTFAMHAEVDGREITPTLNRLAEESFYFPNGFVQTGAGTTADAEFAANTSCYAAPTEAVSVAYVDRELTGLPRTLAAEGYDTVTMHTNEAGFWNRRELYPALGFARYLDEEYFGKKDKIGFSASDEVLYRKGLEELLRMRDTGRPFYANLVTVTSHHPYNALPDRKNPYLAPEPYTGTKVGAYLSHMEYADRALGQFIAELKVSGLWDESIVIVYGDHHAFKSAYFSETDSDALGVLMGREPVVVDRMNVPLLVHVPGMARGVKRQDVVGQVDIMPTVLDLLGVDASGVPMFGRSVFIDSPVVLGVRGYGLAGSLIDETSLVVRTAEGADPVAYRLHDPGTPVAPTEGQIAMLSAASLLLDLSDAYARGLPAREEYAGYEGATIPGVTDQ